MAVVKVFSPSGIKTVEMMGNVSDQAYDLVDEDTIVEDDTKEE